MTQTMKENVGAQVTAEMMIEKIIAAMKAKAVRQAADPVRAAYIEATYEVSREVKKMSTVAAIKKAAKIGVITEDRDEAIWAIYDFKMMERFGDYEMEPSAMAQMIGFENVATQEAKSGRFTPEEVRDIRIARMMGKSYAAIKADGNYDVSKDMIRSICIGECYKDVAVSFIEKK
jgi:hypothetical protein